MASSPDEGSTASIDSTAPRPPTPPREACRDPAASLNKPVPGRPDPPLDSCPSPLQTPPTANTPTSVPPDSIINKSLRKKVEWSAHTEVKEYFDIRRLERLAKSSPASALSPRPIKGILKQSQSHNLGPSSSGLNADGSAGPVNIIDMLGSTIKQLAGSDRHSKLDAYTMLSRALKASNNLPDRVALQSQIGLFMHFIQRDVTHKNPNGESVDSSLTNHALTLLATFLHFPAIASTLTNDFGVWVLDYAIRAFEDASTPKEILRHLMQIVASQSFSSKVMTSARVGRLVRALHQIEKHVTGKSIVLSRLRIYRRLLKQSRGLMALHLDWLDNVFVDMLSGNQEIRAQAITLATEAGFALRSEMQVTRKVAEIFQSANQDRTYIDFFVKRLNEMLGEKQSSAAVPQVWAAVILYLPYPLDRWPHYSPWLKVVQSAFNTDDWPTKQEANFAWNRHIYLTLHDVGKMSSKALSTLCLPLLTQIRKKANPKHPPEAALKLRNTVVGGICTVFYYLLAPDNNQHSADFAWDTAVQPVIAELIALDGKPEIPSGCLMQAACLLLGLLDVTTPRAWAHDRIQKIPPVAPDELPSLDAKWIRRKCDKVMQAVRPIIEHKILELAKRESVVFRMWQALVGSVAAASARDIKVSEDTVKFLACTFSLLSKVWTAGIIEGDGSTSAPFLKSVGNLITVLRDALGLLPFTEKRLLMSAPHAYEPSASPHTPDRTNKSNAIDRPILHHLFLILSCVPHGMSDDNQLTDFLLSMMEPFLNGKPVAARLELVSELLSIPPCNSSPSNGPWVLAARNFDLLIESYHDGGVGASNSTDSGRVLGPQYREIVTLLERGLTGHPDLPSEQWFSLFDRLSDHLAKKFGEAGRCIILIEPLAKVLVDLVNTQNEEMSAMVLQAVRALFDIARFPRDRASLEIARHRLWGTPMNTARSSAFDPFEHLYKLGNHILEIFYMEFRRFDPDQEVSPIIEAVKDFIVRCFPSSRARTLAKLQPGLCLWIKDARSLLGHSLVSKTVSLAWHDVSSELASRRPLDRSDFDSVEPILTAAFQSKQPEIVRSAAETWNLLVQDEDHPDCSDNLKSMASDAVSKAAGNASQQSTGGFGAQAASLPRSQQGNPSLVLLTSTSSSQNIQTPLSPSASDSVSAPKRSKRKRRSEATPSDVSRAKSTKKAATPRSRLEVVQASAASISPSPRAHDEPQSLTGRQRVAGERRRDKAKPCPEQVEDSPYKSATAVTPTPRRGQSLQVDDGDSASSPLKPRAYPLLSEIASRPRDDTIMDSEHWSFSSPLAAPPTGDQQGLHITKSPVVPPSTFPQTAGKAKRAGRSQPPSAGKARSHAVLPPSSAAAVFQEDSQDTEMTDADAASKEVQKSPRLQASKGDPHTPRRSRTVPLPSVEESPRSVDEEEEFVDAKTSFDGCPVPAGPPDNGGDSVDTSVSLSELDESCMTKLTAELQYHNRRVDSPERVEGSRTRGQQERPDASRPVSRGEEESLPPRRSQKSSKTSKRPASPSLPPLVPETKETAGKNRPGQKRKRPDAAQHSNPGKKRRAEVEEIPETPGMQAKGPQPDASPERNLRRSSRRPPPPSVSNVQTRISTRRRPHQDQVEDHHAVAKTAIEAPRTRAGRQNQTQQEERQEQQQEQQPEDQQDDNPDTDDEVMSQLMSESIASSHDSSHIEQELRGDTRRKHKEAQRPPDTRSHETGAKQTTSAAPANQNHEDAEPSHGREGEDQPQSILEGLRCALEKVRKSALSRDEFYEAEDVMMEIKRELFAAERRGREG